MSRIQFYKTAFYHAVSPLFILLVSCVGTDTPTIRAPERGTGETQREEERNHVRRDILRQAKEAKDKVAFWSAYVPHPDPIIVQHALLALAESGDERALSAIDRARPTFPRTESEDVHGISDLAAVVIEKIKANSFWQKEILALPEERRLDKALQTWRLCAGNYELLGKFRELFTTASDDRVIPFLIADGYGSRDSYQRLQEMGAERTEQAVVECLKSNSVAQEKEVAARLAADLKLRRAIPALVQLLVNFATARAQGYQSDKTALHFKVMSSLEAIGPLTLPELRSYVDHADWRVRREVYAVMARAGGAEVLPDLKKAREKEGRGSDARSAQLGADLDELIERISVPKEKE